MAVGHLLTLVVVDVVSTQVPQSGVCWCFPGSGVGWAPPLRSLGFVRTRVFVAFLTPASSSSPLYPGFVLQFG